MRSDANRISMKVCREIMGAAHSFSFQLEGKTVSVEARSQPSAEWQSAARDVSQQDDGPWPPSVELDCSWGDGHVTLSLELRAVVTTNAHDGFLGFTVVRKAQQLLWLTMPTYVKDGVDGSVAKFVGSYVLKKGSDAAEQVNTQVRAIIERVGLPTSGSGVDLFRVRLPDQLLSPASEIFERMVKLSVIKFPVLAGKKLLGGGELPYQLLASVSASSLEDADDEDHSDALSSRAAAPSSPPINRIYFGPPGTGKTFTLSQELKTHYELNTSVAGGDWETRFIAEHLDAHQWWEVLAVVLRELGHTAKVSALLSHPIVQAKGGAQGAGLRQTLWATLGYHAVSDSLTVKTARRAEPAIFDKSEDSVWRLAGDWKDECHELFDLVDGLKQAREGTVSTKRYSFVTFHQSYGYEEFVEGLRPSLDGEELRYEIKAGAFKVLCDAARADPHHRYAMVIDEINRGNIAKIFGELITLIEADKREGAANAVAVVLPYSGKPFSVPANVDIIGSMNTADRSLALLDTALRRRFEFEELAPRPELLDDVTVVDGNTKINVGQLLRSINERVEALYDRDHAIGHAYFMPLKATATLGALAAIFEMRVVPLLQEYFFEDWHKVRLVLADNQKPSDAQFIAEAGGDEGALQELFGTNHGVDSHATRRRYRVQKEAFKNPAAYVGIYTRE